MKSSVKGGERNAREGNQRLQEDREETDSIGLLTGLVNSSLARNTGDKVCSVGAHVHLFI